MRVLSERRFNTGRGLSSERVMASLPDRLLDLLSCDGDRLLRLYFCLCDFDRISSTCSMTLDVGSRDVDRVSSTCSMALDVESESVPSCSVSDESVSLDTGLFFCRCGVLERSSGSFRFFDCSLSDVSNPGGLSTGAADVACRMSPIFACLSGASVVIFLDSQPGKII